MCVRSSTPSFACSTPIGNGVLFCTSPKSTLTALGRKVRCSTQEASVPVLLRRTSQIFHPPKNWVGFSLPKVTDDKSDQETLQSRLYGHPKFMSDSKTLCRILLQWEWVASSRQRVADVSRKRSQSLFRHRRSVNLAGFDTQLFTGIFALRIVGSIFGAALLITCVFMKYAVCLLSGAPVLNAAFPFG